MCTGNRVRLRKSKNMDHGWVEAKSTSVRRI